MTDDAGLWRVSEESRPIAMRMHGGGRSSQQWSDVGLRLSDHSSHAVAIDLRRSGESAVRAATAVDLALSTDVEDMVDKFAQVRPEVGRGGLLTGPRDRLC